MKTILISGLDKTGKSFIGDCFSKYKFKTLDLGNIVREQYKLANLKCGLSDYYEDNLKAIEEILLRKIDIEFQNIKPFEKGIAIIGARSSSLKIAIDKKYSNRFILFVTSQVELRYERYLKNVESRPFEPLRTYEEFIENDKMQFSWGLNNFLENADFVLQNDKNLFALKKQIITLISKHKLNE